MLLNPPAAPATVALYAASLLKPDAERDPPRAAGLKMSTISRRMAAIKHEHRTSHCESPTDTVEVETVLAGMRREAGTAQVGKAAITMVMLRQLVAACPEDTLVGVRDRALLIVGFAGAFRRSALVALDVGDVTFQHEGVVVHIRRDKTDQDGQGREIGLPYGSNPDTCPVRTLKRWLEAAGIAEGPLFRACAPQGTALKVGAKAEKRQGRLSAEDVARIVKRRCTVAGIDPAVYSAHSLRSGFVTAAAVAGVQERVIAEQTGHKSMEVLRRYIRKGTLFKENAAGQAGL